MITTLSILAIIAYLITWGLIVVRFRKQLHSSEQKTTSLLKIVWGVGLLFHATILYLPLLQNGSLSLGLISAISHVLWLISLLLFYTTFKCKIETLGLFIIPAVIVSLIASNFVHTEEENIHLIGNLGVHIFTSLLAYSVLLFSAVQALLLAYQNRKLRKHKPSGLISTLPALQDMEALLFRLIKLGVILLTIALLSGFLYLGGVVERGTAHKILFSIGAWITFSSLLYGHYKYGWRGKIAVRWTLFGSAFLLLAYFGSKFVVEYLLN